MQQQTMFVHNVKLLIPTCLQMSSASSTNSPEYAVFTSKVADQFTIKSIYLKLHC